MHRQSNIIAFPRQDWRAAEGMVRDALRRLGVPIHHSVGAGRDFAVAYFFDDSDGRLLRTQYVFSLEKFARLVAGDG
jgi:hypothetical protein